jgi:hypothetical protein
MAKPRSIGVGGLVTEGKPVVLFASKRPGRLARLVALLRRLLGAALLFGLGWLAHWVWGGV